MCQGANSWCLTHHLNRPNQLLLEYSFMKRRTFLKMAGNGLALSPWLASRLYAANGDVFGPSIFGDNSKTPVMIRLDDAWKIGFLIEKISDDVSTVFMPGAPSATSGEVAFVDNSRIQPLDIETKDAMRLMSRMGIGSSEKLKGVL